MPEADTPAEVTHCPHPAHHLPRAPSRLCSAPSPPSASCFPPATSDVPCRRPRAAPSLCPRIKTSRFRLHPRCWQAVIQALAPTKASAKIDYEVLEELFDDVAYEEEAEGNLGALCKALRLRQGKEGNGDERGGFSGDSLPLVLCLLTAASAGEADGEDDKMKQAVREAIGHHRNELQATETAEEKRQREALEADKQRGGRARGFGNLIGSMTASAPGEGRFRGAKPRPGGGKPKPRG